MELNRIAVVAGLILIMATEVAADSVPIKNGRGPSCIAGAALGGTLEGALGPAPAGVFTELSCLEIQNDQAFERLEVAYSSIPLPASLGLTATDALVVVGPGDERIAAQFDVISRWGGPVDNPALPIRWLQVVVPARVSASATTTYSLRQYAAPPAAADPFAVSIAVQGQDFLVDSGLASFTLDPDHPALISQIAIDQDNDGVGRTTVYTDSPNAGPRLRFVNAGGQEILIGGSDTLFADSFETGGAGSTSGAAGPAVVDAGGFEIVENGPVKVVVALRGHFPDPAGGSVCDPGTTTPYERFGFTAVATFTRASRDIGLQYVFRNECSDALTGPFTDETALVREVSWNLPFDLGTTTPYVAGNGATTAGASNGSALVEQQRGAGTPPNWLRRARTQGPVSENAEFFDRPLVAVADASTLVAAQMPWMRYREPQSLSVQGSTISLGFVADELIVGEAKGLWNFAHLSVMPSGLLPGTAEQFLEARRLAGTARLERGLLVRAPLDQINAALVFPSLGDATPSTIKTNYLAWMNRLHDETVLPGGQFDRNKTYGSQLWPDTGSSDPFGVDADRPNETSSGMNYWDPAGNELLEFLRGGDPKWAWDFAIPAYWVQAHAAYLNIGAREHGNRAGLAITSGGPGCIIDPDTFEVTPCTPDGTAGGQWHRSAFGSDDYTYEMSMELGYVLRPNPALRDRFAHAGSTVMNRYDQTIPEDQREAFVNAVNITRQVIQHFEMLANCAEFVPGQRGLDCDTRIKELVNELARDNLAAGIMCQGEINFNTGLNGDIPGPPAPLPTSCFTPQQFMQNALMYQFFHRYWRNYGDPPDGSVMNALTEAPRVLYQEGLAQLGGGALDPFGDWAAGLDCILNASGTAVVSCVAAQDSDGNTAMFGYNRPHTAALLMMATEIDPALGLCQIVKDVYDVDDFSGHPNSGASQWGGVHFNQAGWWKGVSQMMQGMAFGVGIYDTCTDP